MPPWRLVESPSAETCTSICDPARAKGGSVAVTETAATFWVCMRVPRMLTPSRSSIACIDSSVKGELRIRSPVPARPTTRP